MTKGEDTRSAIVDTALGMARTIGLEGVTIGALASRRQLSKSGVFAHFGSKEELQIAVLQRAQTSFIDEVMKPAFSAPRGVARIRALYEHWVRWSALSGGCPILAAAYEFDDRPGPVRDVLVESQHALRRALIRSVELCIECGDLAPDTDAALVAFQLDGLMMATHFDTRLLDDPHAVDRGRKALEALLRANGATA